MGRKRKRTAQQRDGLLVLNKPGGPEGPTSAACLNQIRRRFSQGRIGHAGTLDPLASGVLLVLLGHGTKLAPYLTQGKKTYQGELRLGMITNTYDIQGKIIAEKSFDRLLPEQVHTAIEEWKTLVYQEVPPVSAAKYQGKPLYALERAGKKVPVKQKEIEIFHVEVLTITLPWIRFRVTVSAGTYIRSLAHSLGKRLGCGAVLTSLIREQCHPFGLDRAVELDELLRPAASLVSFEEHVLSLRDALPHWPALCLDTTQAQHVMQGRRLQGPLRPVTGEQKQQAQAGDRAVFLHEDGRALALAEAVEEGGTVVWSVLRGLSGC